MSKSLCSPVFCVLIFIRSKHTKRQPDVQDAPTDDTRGMMATTIQMKMSRIMGGGGGKIVEKDMDKDAEKDVDEKKDLMKDNSL